MAWAARVGLAALASESPAGTRLKALAIEDVTLVDLTSASPSPKATVILRAGRIEAIGRHDLPVPADAERLDGRGLTLLPGLWDMHAHLKQVEWLPAYLAAGVTTVRDVGNELAYISALRNDLSAADVLGPGVLAAGLIDARPVEGDPYTSAMANTADEGRTLVREYRRRGFQAVKIWNNVSGDVLKAVAAQAHAAGLTVTGHIPRGLTLEGALSLGLDEINHVSFIMEALRGGDATTAAGRRLIEPLRTAGVVVDPTLVVVRYATRPRTTPLAEIEPCAEWMPAELVQVWSAFGVPPDQAAASEAQFNAALAMVRALHAAGVPIVAGSDQGLPGCTLVHELELYVRAGLTPFEALQSATITPARIMGLDQELGTIAVGKRADLILVEGNPLDFISNLRKLRYVIRDGAVLEPVWLRRQADLAAWN